MAAITYETYFSRWLQAVESLGGTIPEEVLAVGRRYQLVKSVLAPSGDPLFGLIEMVTGDQDLSVEEVMRQCRRLATGKVVGEFRVHLDRLDWEAGKAVSRMVRGEAGDRIVGSLGDGISEAVGVIQRASEFFAGGLRLEQAVERWPSRAGEAVELWNGAKVAGAYLDRVLAEVARPLGTYLEILPPELVTDLSETFSRLAIWYVSEDKLHKMDELGKTLTKPKIEGEVPGAKWLEANSLTSLRLNSPSEAIRLLSEAKARREAEEFERYRPKTVDEDLIEIR
jgi:hypothetical protein